MEEEQHVEISTEETQPVQDPAQPGVIKRVFRNRFGHWRTGWRLVVYAIAVYVIGKAVSAALESV